MNGVLRFASWMASSLWTSIVCQMNEEYSCALEIISSWPLISLRWTELAATTEGSDRASEREPHPRRQAKLRPPKGSSQMKNERTQVHVGENAAEQTEPANIPGKFAAVDCVAVTRTRW
jgi:hypothetical protein